MSNPFPPKSIIKDPLQPPNLFYRGSSMRGTFKPGDKLIIEKVPFDRIKKGDLIIFSRNENEEDDFIVHRVVAVNPKGLVTRGDNCFDNDKNLVIEENIVGRVIANDRRGKVHQVQNGRAGAFRAAMLHSRLQVINLVKFFLRKPYLILKKSGFITKIWQPEIDIFQFQTSDGPLVKYVHKGKTVAICWTDQHRWWVKRPFCFFLNPK